MKKGEELDSTTILELKLHVLNFFSQLTVNCLNMVTLVSLGVDLISIISFVFQTQPKENIGHPKGIKVRD